MWPPILYFALTGVAVFIVLKIDQTSYQTGVLHERIKMLRAMSVLLEDELPTTADAVNEFDFVKFLRKLHAIVGNEEVKTAYALRAKNLERNGYGTSGTAK